MNKLFSKIFMWLCLGLLVTFGVAYTVSSNDNMVYNLFADGKYLIVWIVELVVVIILSARIHKMSYMTAIILFLLYSGLTGLTLSSIFILYDIFNNHIYYLDICYYRRIVTVIWINRVCHEY